MTTAHEMQELTSGEAALLLGCTNETVRDLASRGRLRWRRLDNGGWVFRLDDVLVLAEERRRKPETRGRPIKLRRLIDQVKVSSAVGASNAAVGVDIGSASAAVHPAARRARISS